MPSQPLVQVSDFSANPGSFTLMGNASIQGTTLQLTDASGSNEVGTGFYNQALSVGAGLSFRFDYTSSGGGGADGLSLLIVDADQTSDATQINPGARGGGLGYRAYPSIDGLSNGFLGIGFDSYGNFESGGGGGNAAIPDSVGVRAEGNGQTGYGLLTSNVYSQGIEGDRTAIVNIIKVSNTQERVQVMVAPTGSNNFETVVDTIVDQQLPSKFFVGFGASTGGLNDNHIIRNFTATLAPASVSLGAVTLTDNTTNQVNPAYINPGDQFTETYTVVNNGTDDSEITVSDMLPANVVGQTWTVMDSAGSSNGTGSSIPVSLTAGQTATITVTGQVDHNASAGNANHAITVSAGNDYDNQTSGPTTVTSAIVVGQGGGGSVNLVAANQTVMDSDVMSVMPFAGGGSVPASTIVDTYSDPSNPNMETLTVTASPSSGTLSATNATYDPSTGTLTASGTAAQVQSILQSVTFTPVAHTAAPGTVTPVQLTVTVLSTTPGNNTGAGGGEPSATQTETISVTSSHDTPAISGAAAGLVVDDDSSVSPFGSVVVSDPDYTGATAVVTLSGGAFKGDFTAASSSGWTRAIAGNGDVTYTETFAVQGNVGAVVQTALRGLVFKPSTLVSTETNPTPVNLAVSVTDTASTPATGTGTASLNVRDATAPVAPTALALSAMSDTGVQGDQTTNQATPSITGMAESGSTVTVYDGQQALGMAAIDASGKWTFAPSTALSDGSHQLSAMDTDEAGLMSGLSSSYSLTVDTTAPIAQTLNGITSTGQQAIKAGQQVSFVLSTNEPVNVNTAGGVPFLTLNDGGTAAYVGQQDAQHLVFAYTASAGENSANLTVTGLQLGGGTVTDAAGNEVDTSSIGGAQGAGTGIVVDTISPTDQNNTPSGASLIMAGQNVTFTVTTSEAVTVSTAGGTPYLMLDDGGMAFYAGQQDGRSLLFSYTAAAGQNTSNLTITGFSANGGAIADAAGNTVVPTSFGNAQGSATGIVVDTTGPSATSISAATTTGVGVVAAGQGVTFTVATSEAVSVSTAGGTPYLTLDDGGTASYAGQQDAQHLVFSYIAAPGQNTGSLTVTGLEANGGTIADPAGNAAISASFASAQGASTGVAVNTQAAPTTYNQIYRFFNTTTGSHFYTGSAAEEAQVRATRPDLVEETNTFQGVDKNGPSAEAIYRFFNTTNGEHFLTSNQAEVQTVMQTRPDLTYEGADFYAHATQQAGDSAVYRFFDTANGSHLYTTAESERASVAANPGYVSEGIAFWAPLTK